MNINNNQTESNNKKSKKGFNDSKNKNNMQQIKQKIAASINNKQVKASNLLRKKSPCIKPMKTEKKLL